MKGLTIYFIFLSVQLVYSNGAASEENLKVTPVESKNKRGIAASIQTALPNQHYLSGAGNLINFYPHQAAAFNPYQTVPDISQLYSGKQLTFLMPIPISQEKLGPVTFASSNDLPTAKGLSLNLPATTYGVPSHSTKVPFVHGSPLLSYVPTQQLLPIKPAFHQNLYLNQPYLDTSASFVKPLKLTNAYSSFAYAPQKFTSLSPSLSYGPPVSGFQSQASSQFASSPESIGHLSSQSYGPPSPSSSSYGPPSSSSASYGPPSHSSASYGSPSHPSASFGSPSSHSFKGFASSKPSLLNFGSFGPKFNPNSFKSNHFESSKYSPPSFSSSYEPSSSKYGPPTFDSPKYSSQSFDSPKYSSPSFDSPKFSSQSFDSHKFNPQSFESSKYNSGPSFSTSYDPSSSSYDLPSSLDVSNSLSDSFSSSFGPPSPPDNNYNPHEADNSNNLESTSNDYSHGSYSSASSNSYNTIAYSRPLPAGKDLMTHQK